MWYKYTIRYCHHNRKNKICHFNNVDGPREYSVKLYMSDQERQILIVVTYMQKLNAKQTNITKQKRFLNPEYKSVVVRVEESRGIGKICVWVLEVQLQVMK